MLYTTVGKYLGQGMRLKIILILFLTKSLVFWSIPVLGQDSETEYDPLLLFPDVNLDSEFDEN